MNYIYDENTKEYIGSQKKQLNPRATKTAGKEVYFSVPNTTDIEPNETNANEVSVWNGDKWEIKTDNRGLVYYTEDGTQEIIKEIDTNIPEGCYSEDAWVSEKLAQDKLDNYDSYRKTQYVLRVDPITCQISRLSDEEQTEEVIAKIAELKTERSTIVAEIQAKYPKPEDE